MVSLDCTQGSSSNYGKGEHTSATSRSSSSCLRHGSSLVKSSHETHGTESSTKDATQRGGRLLEATRRNDSCQSVRVYHSQSRAISPRAVHTSPRGPSNMQGLRNSQPPRSNACSCPATYLSPRCRSSAAAEARAAALVSTSSASARCSSS